MNKSTLCKKMLTVFINTAVFVRNKEQFWNRACYSEMRSKKQSDFHKNSIVTNNSCPHLPLTQGCCGDHRIDRPKTPHLVVQNSNRNGKTTLGGHLLLLTSSTWNCTRLNTNTFQSNTPETTAQMQNGWLLAYHKHLKMALTLSQQTLLYCRL